ncbi:hypothetical protein GQ457_03G036790 [Hibiscus cannabinus]
MSETVDVSMQEEDGVATQTMQVDGNEGSHGIPSSYAATVAGPRASKAPAKKVLNPDDIVVLDEDVCVDDSGPYTTISFSDRVHAAIDQSMCQSVIIRLLGRQIGYRVLWNRIKALWMPQGQFQLVDLENEYFLVKFEVEADYVKVLADGPWTIFGSYLTVQPWTREFSTAQDFPTHVLVWVRLPGLPYRYYTKEVFRRIATVLGRIVRVDYNTMAGDRGKFARLAILVDLKKPLRPCLGIDGFLQQLEYEGLHNICFKCGLYGHSRDLCGHPGEEIKTPSVQEKHSFPFTGSERKAVDAEELYGPWMLASNRRRRSRRLNDTGKMADPNAGKSRFDVLASDGSEELIPSDVVSLNAVPGMESDVSPPVLAPHSMAGGSQGATEGGNSGNRVNREKKGVEFTVVPMVPGRTPTVVDGSSGPKGSHQAVTIIDDGIDMGGGKSGGLKKRSPGVSKLRLQVRKQSEFKAPNLPLLSEWVNSLSSGDNAVKHVPRNVVSSTSQAEPPDMTHAMPVVHKTGPDIGYSGSKMVALFWNCQGASNLAFRGHFRRVVREACPSMVALFEPRFDRASGVCYSSLRQSRATLRQFLWSKLTSLNPGSEHAWILGGDFNAIYDSVDRMGGARTRLGISRGMADFVFNTGLVDGQFRGPRFTWKRGSLSQRLNRCLFNDKWLDLFSDSVVLHMDLIGSDHRPILLKAGNSGDRNAARPFRFVFAWQDHPDFKQLLLDTWKNDDPVEVNLQHCKETLTSWNSNNFGHIGQRKRRILSRLRGIDNYFSSRSSTYLSTLENSLKAELDVVLEQEESLWLQKSRCKWFCDGDRNTKYFHACARERKRVNTISALRKEGEGWCEEQIGLRQIAVSYYASLFTSSGSSSVDYAIRDSFKHIDDRRWEVQFRFVRRDGNVPADVMARLAWQGSLGYHRYLEPPSAVRDALLRDVSCPAPVGM